MSATAEQLRKLADDVDAKRAVAAALQEGDPGKDVRGVVMLHGYRLYVLHAGDKRLLVLQLGPDADEEDIKSARI